MKSSDLTFKDVSASAWFYPELRAAVGSELINGVSKSKFEPSGQLTVAQAITMAARVHQLYSDEEVTLKNGWWLWWYKPYVKYAEANDLISQEWADYSRKEMKQTVTWGQFVELISTILPEDAYTPVNEVAEDALGDQTDFVYTLFRAGVLPADTDDGLTFDPDSTIKRSEAAVIIVRMLDSDYRILQPTQ